MDQLSKKTIKAGIWYTICTFVVKAMSFITTPFFTRLVSTQDVGQFANMSSWISLLSGVFTLDLYTSINLAHYKYEKDIYKYMSTMALLGTAFTGIIYLISYAFKAEVMEWLGISELMLHVMFIYFLVNPAILMLHAKFRIHLQYNFTIITSLLPALLSMILSLTMVIAVKGEKLNARVLGYYSVWIFFGVLIYTYIIIKGHLFKWEYVKFALPISVPLIIHTFSNTILSSSDRVMIQRFCGSESTALYSIAYSCAMVVSILWTSINQAFAPWCYELMHRGEERKINRVAKPILIIFSCGVFLSIIIAPEILYIMGGDSYMQAVYVIPPVMVGYIAQMIYTLYVNIEYYNKKQKYTMIGTIIAAIINLVLNFIFIPIFGYGAAAYTTLASYIVLLIIHYFVVKGMGKDYIYDIKFNFLLLAVMVMSGLFISMLYTVKWMRYGIVAFIFCGFSIVCIKEWPHLSVCIKNKDIVGMLRVFHFIKGELE